MLVAILPANVYKAATQHDLPWDDALVPRMNLQVVFVASVVVVLVYETRQARRRLTGTVQAPIVYT